MITLSEISTKAPKELDKKEIKEQTNRLLDELDGLQNLLYAEGKHAVLAIMQGMDASGKDGAVKNVFGRLNPAGILVHAFKEPTEEELKHDFLWRVHQYAPAKGMVQVFNRSHYEDVLITRVHGWCDDTTAGQRFQCINNFEQLLAGQNATVILKFYLHVSQEEQKKRFEERVKDPAKHWKYSKKDLEEAQFRDKYIRAYEDVFANCNMVPWIIVPADQNWYKEYVIAQKLNEALKGLHMQYPDLPKDK